MNISSFPFPCSDKWTPRQVLLNRRRRNHREFQSNKSDLTLLSQEGDIFTFGLSASAWRAGAAEVCDAGKYLISQKCEVRIIL